MGLLEKAKIKWFSYDELKKDKKEFRSFYQNIVDLIIKQEKFINRKVKKEGKYSETKRENTQENKINIKK